MKASTAIFVIVACISLTIVQCDDEPGFTKEAILELDEVLVKMDISKPDENRVNKDVKTLIEEALHDLKTHIENRPDPDGLELCMVTISALEIELKRLEESENGNQDATPNPSEMPTTTSAPMTTEDSATPSTTSATPLTTTTTPPTTKPTLSATTASSTTTSSTPETTTSSTLNMSD